MTRINRRDAVESIAHDLPDGSHSPDEIIRQLMGGGYVYVLDTDGLDYDETLLPERPHQRLSSAVEDLVDDILRFHDLESFPDRWTLHAIRLNRDLSVETKDVTP